eukprot:COSAG05_NODE_12849_length_452_cov_0.575071_1_plen_70_part_10
MLILDHESLSSCTYLYLGTYEIALLYVTHITESVRATVAWRCLCTIYSTIDVVAATTTPRSVIYLYVTHI